MPRCRSWRFIGFDVPDQSHLPVGADHTVWARCRTKVPAGVYRCPNCAHSLITCPNPAIRRALANEADLDSTVLSALLSDPDAQVAQIASDRLEGFAPAGVGNPAEAAAEAEPQQPVYNDPWS